MVNKIEDLEAQVTALENALSASGAMVAAFQGELVRMQHTMVFTNREVGGLTTSIGTGLRRAFDGLAFDGGRLSDALRSVAQSITQSVYNTALKPVQNALGGAIAGGLNSALSGAMPFAKGGAFSQGRVMPFAQGGIVSSPVEFPMRGGRGLMGEAGPEAIMPLTRGADGRLGVQAAGGGKAVTVVMNISTPDIGGFQRSKSQIAAQMTRALSVGQRNR